MNTTTPTKPTAETKTTMSKKSKPSIKPLTGLAFCVTGKTFTKRAELKDIIIKNGGKFVSAVNSTCTHLIIADPTSTTVKANVAREMGVELIGEDEFFEMIGG